MIKLTTLLKEIEQDRIEELGVKDIALGAMMAASTLGGAKAGTKAPTKAPTSITQTTQDTTKTITPVDGVVGSVTSEFKFMAPERIETIMSAPSRGVPSVVKSRTRTTQPLSTVKQFIKTDITSDEMKEWNNFADWLEKKGYAGDTIMDHGSDKIAIVQYVEEEKGGNFDNFFLTKGVKDIDKDYELVKTQVKRVQESIKSYRNTWIKLWKAGRAGIVIGGKSMVPGVDDDRVEEEEWDATVF